PHTHLMSDDGVYMALRSYFQSAVACVRGESGPSSVNSILTPLGPVALATTHCLPTVRGSPTVTPRCFKAAIVAFIFSTCNPKCVSPGGRLAFDGASSRKVLRLAWTKARVGWPLSSRNVSTS